MEPIPETADALRELTRHGDPGIANALWSLSRAVQRAVPELVGLSLSFVGDTQNLTFTMTATGGSVAELDGVQYLDSGPCEEMLRSGEPRSYRSGAADDEERWKMFARATSSAGVASTLSLPILREGSVVAGVNLYASTADAFRGRHDELAAICGAHAGDVTTNADLDFRTRFEAAETPDRIRGEQLIHQATGAVMSLLSLGKDEAGARLRDAARRAGISDAQMARAVLGLLDPSHEG